ncbi:MAG: RNA polymerase sigma factor [Prolixibacteraceae bacterium]|nr:RNA polymerase sigma factor [Prolixibacteraceae bacterium]
MRYAKDVPEAEDNLQDGFITVFSKLKDYRHEGSFEGWVRRIMVNISINKFRGKQQFVFLNETKELNNVAADEHEDFGKIPVEKLIGLIQELPSQYRMVFNLYVMEGMSHKEIGDQLGISEGTSKSNLSRARGILRSKLEKQIGTIRKSRRYSI